MIDRALSRLLPHRRLPRHAVLGLGVLMVAVLVWAGVVQYRARAAMQTEYIHTRVERGDIEDLVTATGALQPRDYVDVGAQVSGQLQRIVVKVGDTVTERDLLAEIDATQSEARVAANRASLKAQETQLRERDNALVKAERDQQRQLNLQREDATTTEAVQNAETALVSASLAVLTLRAQIEQQRASMRIEETNLQFTRILAPMSGTVVSITAKQGQTLNTNQQAPTILRIADLSTMSVQTQVSEADVPKLAIGMPAYFTTLGSAGRRWYGTLARIEPTPTVQNNVVLYNALFEVDNAGGPLLPQMTAQVFFVRAAARGVVSLPMSALQQGEQYLEQQRESGAALPSGQAAGGERDRAYDASAGAERPRRGRPDGGGPREAGAAGGPYGAAGQAEAPPQRRGTVLVRQADGRLQTRNVLIGVTNRVQGEVLSGLQEGEEVVAGQREPEVAPIAAGAAAADTNAGALGGVFQGGRPR